MAMTLTWRAPGEGVWWLTREHFPGPVSGLFAAIFPAATSAWVRGAARFGLPLGEPRWAAVNSWFYYSSGPVDPATYPRLDEAARRALATSAWRDEVRQWFDIERPRVVAVNRALQACSLAFVDDAALSAHFSQALDHFLGAAPLHFEHSGFDVVAGLLFTAVREWGLEQAEMAPLLTGSSPASSATVVHLDRIARALLDAGVEQPSTLAEVEGASDGAKAALDAYRDEFGWRLIEGHDVAEPTLNERPDVVLMSIRARLSHLVSVSGAPASADTGTQQHIDSLRARVPMPERNRFDELVADTRSSYQLRDDDGGVCFGWPLGLIRRAVLEAGGRLVSRGALEDPAHLFEATPAEIVALLGGSGPPAPQLAARAERRQRAAGAVPPPQLGEPVDAGPEVPLPTFVAQVVAARDAYWAAGGARSANRLEGTGVGGEVRQGRACVLDTPDAIADLQPGDVLIATATTAAHNAVFPIVAAVATEEGGLFSHAAILSRELGIPAVVGVAGLLRNVHHGDFVEVDPAAGVVRVIRPAAQNPRPD